MSGKRLILGGCVLCGERCVSELDANSGGPFSLFVVACDGEHTEQAKSVIVPVMQFAGYEITGVADVATAKAEGPKRSARKRGKPYV